jgi:hypothetical protein
VGVFNVLLALALIGFAVYLRQMPVGEFEDLVARAAKSYPPIQQILEEARRQGATLAQMKQQAGTQYTVGGGVALLAALLTILGGVFMLKRRAYGLAMTGAILSAIPCISPLGCCGMGEAVGLWALIVLLNNDVRMAFRASGTPPEGGGPAF